MHSNLIEAAKKGDVQTIKQQLSINTNTLFEIAMIAITGDHFELYKFLSESYLNRKLNVSYAQDRDFYHRKQWLEDDAFKECVKTGKISMVRLFMARGGAIPPYYKEEVFKSAAIGQHWDIVEMFMRCGVSPHEFSNCDKEKIQQIYDTYCRGHETQMNDKSVHFHVTSIIPTMVVDAARSGNIERFERSLWHTVHLGTIHRSLLAAIESDKPEMFDHIASSKRFIDMVEEPEFFKITNSILGRSRCEFLDHAAKVGSILMYDHISKYPASSFEHWNIDDFLMTAVQNGKYEMTKYLLTKGPNIKGLVGAIEKRNIPILQLLAPHTTKQNFEREYEKRRWKYEDYSAVKSFIDSL